MLICKKCGYKLEDSETIKYLKRKFPHTEEHDIPYYCGACLDNASDEEYDTMISEMNNPEFQKNKSDIAEALNKSLSYDEWSAREYGEDRLDVEDTADNLAANGIVKDATLVENLIDEIDEVVEQWGSTIGSIFIKKKLNEIRARYGIAEGKQKHTSEIANRIYNELMIHAYYPNIPGESMYKVVDEDDIKSVCQQYIDGGIKE